MLVGALVEVAQVVVVVAQNLLVTPGQHQHGDGGAVVAGTLQMGQGVHEQQAGGDGAGAVLQALGVAVPQQPDHVVDDLLQRLDGLGQLRVVVAEDLDGGGQDLGDGTGQNLQLPDGLLGEGAALGAELLADLLEIGGIVADALEGGDGLQQHIQVAVIALALDHLAQTDQELVGGVAELIQGSLLLGDLLGEGGIIGHQLAAAALEVLQSHGAHEGDGLVGLLQGHGGGDVQILAQTGQLGMTGGLLRLVLDDGLGQSDQCIGEGDQQGGGQQIEDRLEVGDAAGVHIGDPEGFAEDLQLLHDQHDDQERDGADGVEGDVDDTGALGVPAGADGADHGGGDAGAQVDAHDHRVGHGEGDAGAGDLGHGLEHTNGGGGALDDDGQDQAEEDAEHGVVQETDEGGEGVGADQGLDAVGHQVQTHEEDAEADGDVADGLGVLLLDEHDQDDADHQGDGGQGIGIEEPQQPAAVGLDGTQADDLGGDGGTDVGTHDDGHGLPQVQHAGADQGHGQHDGGGGGLDDSGDQGTGQDAHEHIAGDFLQHPFQGCAGAVLQAVAHQLNAVEEHGQTAQQLDDGS